MWTRLRQQVRVPSRFCATDSALTVTGIFYLPILKITFFLFFGFEQKFVIL